METDACEITFEDLLTHADWARRLAGQLAPGPEGAEDLVQDTWEAALRCPPRSRRAVRPWLGRVMRNFAWQRYRRPQPALSVDGDAMELGSAAGGSAAEEAELRELRRIVAQAVLDLPEPYGETVLQCYYRGWTPAEIARRGGLPQATVRSRLKRGRDRIREALEERLGRDRAAWSLALLALPGRDPARPLAGVLTAALVLAVAAVSIAWWPGAGKPADAADAARVTRVDVPTAVRNGGAAPARRPLPAVAAAPGSETEPGPGGRLLPARVIDPQDSPVAGATVLVRPASPGAADRVLGLTDGEGRLGARVFEAELGSPPDAPGLTERAALYAHSAGHASSELYFVPCAAEGAPEVTLRLGGPDLTLRGTVLDPDGNPIPGARIELEHQLPRAIRLAGDLARTDLPFETRSDPGGAFAFPHLAPALYRLRAAAGGYVPAVQLEHPDGGASHSCTLVLARGGAVAGIASAPDGTPSAGARVAHEVAAGEWIETTADGGGRFRLAGLPAGEQELVARAGDGSGGAARVRIEVRAGEETEWHPVLATPAGIRLRLTGEAGQPLAGWTLVLALDGAESAGWTRRLATDAEGRAALLEDPGAPVRAFAYPPDGHGWPLAAAGGLVPGPRERLLTVAASAGEMGRIEGRVLDHAELAFPAAILLMRDSGTRAIVELEVDRATGEFSAEIPPTRLQIEVRCGDRGGFPAGVHTVYPGEVLDLGVLRAPPPGTLRVLGEWPGGEGAGELEFALHEVLPLGSEWIFDPIDQGARRPAPEYSVLPGTFVLYVARAGVVFQQHQVELRSGWEARFRIGEGAVPAVPVRVELPAGGPAVRAVELDVGRLADGLPTHLETVRLERGPSGAFESFLELDEGRYALEARVGGGRRGTLEFELDAGQVIRPLEVQVR